MHACLCGAAEPNSAFPAPLAFHYGAKPQFADAEQALKAWFREMSNADWAIPAAFLTEGERVAAGRVAAALRRAAIRCSVGLRSRKPRRHRTESSLQERSSTHRNSQPAQHLGRQCLKDLADGNFGEPQVKLSKTKSHFL